MKIISVANLKGGVGKTTITANLAGPLLERGARVLLFDLDHQTNLTSVYANPDYDPDEGPGISRGLMNGIDFQKLIHETPTPNLFIVPGDFDLVLLDSHFANNLNATFYLAERLEELEGFDYVLIDTPPYLGVATRMALVASTGYLVPLDADVFAYKGLQRLEDEVEQIRKRVNRNLRCLGYVLNKVQGGRTLIEENIRRFRERLGEQLLKTELRLSVKYAEARTHRLPVTHHPATKGTEWAELYRELVKEIDL